MKRNLFLCYLLITVLNVGCGNESGPSEQPVDKRGKSLLKINFTDNVIEIDPDHPGNTAEQFVEALVFKKLNFNSNTGLCSYSFDSVSNIFRISLQPEARFHNDSTITSHTLYKTLQTYLSNSPEGATFFKHIKGYPLTQWYRDNRNIKDHMPDGIKTEGDSILQIELVGDLDSFITDYSISRGVTLKDSIYGTGPFKISKLHDDIEVSLSRGDDQIDTGYFDEVQMTFYKSDTIILQNFLLGKVDLFEFNLDDMDSSYTRNYLAKQVNTKYAEHGIYRGRRVKVSYTRFSELSDSLKIAQTIDSIQPIVHYIIDNQEVSIMNNQKVQESGETILNNSSNNPDALIEQLVANLPVEHKKSGLIVIMKINPYYYLARKDLTGIKDYQSLAEIVKTGKISETLNF